MGRVAISSDNKTGEGNSGFPSIKLTEKGQKTRFTLLEKPWREYVHYIKAPKFNDNGKPKKTKRTRRNGDEYEDFDLELVGTEICLGDEGTLRDKGLDEADCPACEASVQSGGDIPGPIQRFSVNVAEYVTTPAGGIKKPFSATIKVWKFTGRIYDEIEGIQAEIGDLRKHDITLECEDPYWNKNKLSFKMEPGYQSAPQGYMKELLSTPGNKATDAQLKDACGREVSRARMQDDVDYARRQWRRLNAESGDVPEEFKSTAADLDGGLDELLNGEGDPGTVLDKLTPEQRAAAVGSADDPFVSGGELATDDPFAEFAAETTTSPSQEAKRIQEQEETFAPGADEKPGTASAPTSSGEDFDFDGLLDGI